MSDRAPNRMEPKSASFSAAAGQIFSYVEKINPATSNLQFLTYGIYECAGRMQSGALAHPGEEALLFCVLGTTVVEVSGRACRLEPYDVLYIPMGAAYRFRQDAGEARVAVCRAPATNAYEPFYARWAEFSRDERRLRHLQGKDVVLMFDVTERADRLMAGFTLFQRHQRSWPPHKHSDQEEIYIFTRGRGSMEVYADEETKTFVRSVAAGDAVTIPMLNFHPVFTQDEELHFIWCIAGERYWVGDKDKDFMAGQGDRPKR